MVVLAPKKTAERTFHSPDEALQALLARLGPVGTETIGLNQAAGRVLAQPLTADRESPACDVSAMDGYAVRVADAAKGSLTVAGEAPIGQPPRDLPPGQAMRIFTGAPLPHGAEAVIKREDVQETTGNIAVPYDLSVSAGQHIRCRGENARAGSEAVPVGVVVSPAVAAAAATFGARQLSVYRALRVAVLVTGNEVLDAVSPVQPWQLRDANGPSVAALLAPLKWAQVAILRHLPDDLSAIVAALREALAVSDAVILTGGVSVGDHDHVPAAIEAAQGQIVFHRLPMRPGKPVLGAVGPGGQVIMGLPGNPVSVLTTARRFAVPALRRRAGFAQPLDHPALLTVHEDGGACLPLYWHRLVRLIGAGEAELVPTQGSGDVVSAAGADGFVEVPPGRSGSGPWPFYCWSVT